MVLMFFVLVPGEVLVSAQVFAGISCDSVTTCLSNFLCSTLPSDFTSLTDGRFIPCSVCLAFYFLLGWSGDFKDPYILEKKPQVHMFITIVMLCGQLNILALKCQQRVFDK